MLKQVQHDVHFLICVRDATGLALFASENVSTLNRKHNAKKRSEATPQQPNVIKLTQTKKVFFEISL